MIKQFHTTPYETPGERQAVSELSNAERQALIENLLVTYPVFDKIIEFIEKFHYPVKNGTHGKGYIGGLFGKTRAGKSDIVKYYLNRWPQFSTDDGVVVPVVYIEVPGDIVPTQLAEMFYAATGSGTAPKIKLPALMANSVERVIQAQTQLVILDDAQFLFAAKKNFVKEFFSLIKQLADKNAFNILLVGEESVIPHVYNLASLAGRGGFPKEVLKPFDGDEMDEFRLLLHKIDLRLPFPELSKLASSSLAQELHDFTGGATGQVVHNLIRPAAYRALSDGSPRILRHHLYEEAALRMRPGDTREYFKEGN